MGQLPAVEALSVVIVWRAHHVGRSLNVTRNTSRFHDHPSPARNIASESCNERHVVNREFVFRAAGTQGPGPGLTICSGSRRHRFGGLCQT